MQMYDRLNDITLGIPTPEELTNKTELGASLYVEALSLSEARLTLAKALLKLAEIREVVDIFREHGISFYYVQPKKEGEGDGRD